MKRRWTFLLLGALALLNLTPLLVMLAMSARGSVAETSAPVWGGPWQRLADSAPIFGRWLANSAIVTGVSVAFHLIADAMAGYVLAKRRFRGRGWVFALILVSMTIPRQVTLIPLFLGMARAGLADTLAGLILPGLGDVIGIFLMRQFFITLPDALLDAARLDGATEWGVFWRVAMPLARPALGVLGVLAFQRYWSDFFWPLVVAQRSEAYTVQVGLAFMSRSEFGTDISLMAAGATAAAVPMLVVFVIARRWFFEGLRGGALQG